MTTRTLRSGCYQIRRSCRRWFPTAWHQCGVAHHVERDAIAHVEQHREAHGVDAHPPLARLVGTIQLCDGAIGGTIEKTDSDFDQVRARSTKLAA